MDSDLGHSSTTALHAQATHRRSISKETKLVGGPYTSQGVVPLCSRTPVVRVGERSMWDGGGGGGRGKPRVV